MIDGTKHNMKKLFALVMRKVESEEESTGDPQTDHDASPKISIPQQKNREVKTELLNIFKRKFNKNIQRLEESNAYKNTQ